MKHVLQKTGIMSAFFLTLFSTGCEKSKTETATVATVRDRAISAGEFAFDYELSPRSVTQQNPEKAKR